MIKLTQQEQPEEKTKVKILPLTESLKFEPILNRSSSAPLIFMSHSVFMRINKHLLTTLERELGGFLLGGVYHCPKFKQRFIFIDEALEAQDTESNAVRLRFTNDSYAHLEEYREKSNKTVLGWYHSHPKMGIFLSDQDMFIHQGFFREPYQVALVVEPEKHLGGFFHWSNKVVDPYNYAGFYDYLDTEEPMPHWTNMQPVTTFPEYIYNLLSREEVTRFLDKIRRFLPGGSS